MLKVCEECQQDISDKAFSCPNCGNPNFDIKNRVGRVISKGKERLDDEGIPEKIQSAKKFLVKRTEMGKQQAETLAKKIKDASENEPPKVQSIKEFNAEQNSTPCSRCGSATNQKPMLLKTATTQQILSNQNAATRHWCWKCINGQSQDQIIKTKRDKGLEKILIILVKVFLVVALSLILLSFCSNRANIPYQDYDPDYTGSGWEP